MSSLWENVVRTILLVQLHWSNHSEKSVWAILSILSAVCLVHYPNVYAINKIAIDKAILERDCSLLHYLQNWPYFN
jgi:hypothetical protein